VRLTPIQEWYFEQGRIRPEHYNQAVLLEVRRGLRAEWMEEVLGALVERHGALRMQFERGPEGHWRQQVRERESVRVFARNSP